MVVGLGNPGPRYEGTRHNVGFMVAEEFLSRHGKGAPREEKEALVAEARCAGQVVLVVRPLSFMNLSGKPVEALARRYGVLPSEMVLLYDDSDLPTGQIRVRPGGGAGGHRGMESVIEALGTSEIPRIRMGIGRPGGEHGGLADYVLERFEETELNSVRTMIERSAEALQVTLKRGVKAAMNLYNQRSGKDPRE